MEQQYRLKLLRPVPFPFARSRKSLSPDLSSKVSVSDLRPNTSRKGTTNNVQRALDQDRWKNSALAEGDPLSSA